MKLTDGQVRIIVDSVKAHGNLALAAANVGIGVSALKRAIAADPDLQIEIDDAMELFHAAVDLMVQQRAQTSDAMLKLVAERRGGQAYKPEAVDPRANKRPSGLTLRQFNEDGTEAEPAEPLKLGFNAGLL